MKSYSGSLVEYINEDDGKDNEDGNVYVVRGSSRYHVYRTCFHINIQAIPSTLALCRKGAGYLVLYVPEGKAGDNDTVYYTKSGTRYHLNPECGEITRNLVTMTLEEAKNAGYTECRDCEKCGFTVCWRKIDIWEGNLIVYCTNFKYCLFIDACFRSLS